MTASTATSRTLAVPDCSLYYELRGSGPLLVVAGSPMGADMFAPVADALATDHTVVTLDPRGIGRSRLADPLQDSTPDLRADDVAAILDDLGAQSADMIGSSGGAVTGLALVARHPDRVGTLVAHEPPLLELMPDAAEQRAATDDLVATFHAHGVGAAWAKFMGDAGFDDDVDAPGTVEPSEQDLADSAHFFAHEIQGTTRYLPDVGALVRGPARVVVGVGVESAALLTARTSAALAALLGTPPAVFPGDHGGFLGAPQAFADRVREVLASG